MLDVGTDELEERLYQRAENICAEAEPLMPDPAAPLPRMTIAEAIHLLHLQKRRMLELGRKPGRWKRPRTLDEVHDSILRKFSVIARKRGLI